MFASSATGRSVAPMRYILLPLLVVAASLMASCAHRSKSSSQIYEGDGPGIHFTERQGAGGRVGTERYR